MTEFLLWHPANLDAVAACIARARENARSVREEISSEMWEHLNRLHLYLARQRRAHVLAHPHDFLGGVRGARRRSAASRMRRSRAASRTSSSCSAPSIERADASARAHLGEAARVSSASERRERSRRPAQPSC